MVERAFVQAQIMKYSHHSFGFQMRNQCCSLVEIPANDVKHMPVIGGVPRHEWQADVALFGPIPSLSL
jgi:hypothetical protein